MRAICALDVSPFRLVFAGGTCLARAHRLVSRMSEDVDFKVVAPDAWPAGRSKRRDQLGNLRKKVIAGLHAAGFRVGPHDVESRDDNHYSLYNLHYAGSGGAVEPLRATIQVELSCSALRLATIALPVASFFAQAFGRAPEIAAVDCVSVTETAAEKLVALMRRTAMELRGLGASQIRIWCGTSMTCMPYAQTLTVRQPPNWLSLSRLPTQPSFATSIPTSWSMPPEKRGWHLRFFSPTPLPGGATNAL